jgi:hypothetical protein
METLGKILKFLFPKTIEKLLYLDKLAQIIVFLQHVQRLHGIPLRQKELEEKVEEFNKNKMWFMDKVEM